MNENLILITIECLPLKYIGYTNRGNRDSLTPNIDEVASQGLFFKNAFSTSSWTPPSFKSLLAAQYPFSNSGYLNVRNRRLISEILSKEGYQVGAFHDNPWLTEIFGYKKGFNKFLQGENEKKAFLSSIRNKINSYLPSEPYKKCKKMRKEALDWMEKKRDKFFAWIHFMDTHEPHLPDFGFYDFLKYKRAMKLNKNARNNNLSEKEKKRLKKYYKSEIKKVDRQIGSIASRIKKLGLENQTYIIITSDHGQQFYEHGGFGHGLELYNELINVPLIITGPGIDRKETEKVVSHIDLPKTILDLLEVRQQISDWRGESIISEEYSRAFAFSEEGRSERWGPEKGIDAQLENSRRKISMTDGAWKYIYSESGIGELYNLVSDPSEEKNLAGVNEEKTEELKKRILEFALRNETEKPIKKSIKSRVRKLKKDGKI